jgi:hypothetical protein
MPIERNVMTHLDRSKEPVKDILASEDYQTTCTLCGARTLLDQGTAEAKDPFEESCSNCMQRYRVWPD